MADGITFAYACALIWLDVANSVDYETLCRFTKAQNYLTEQYADWDDFPPTIEEIRVALKRLPSIVPALLKQEIRPSIWNANDDD